MQKAKEFTLELGKIDAGENPLRLEGEDKGIAELAASISRIGLINPLVVAPDGERYRLIAGHRRYAACRIAGLKEVTVRITGTDQREICEVALAENLFRRDLSPIEMAVAVVALIKKGGMDREQVASVCQRSIAWVKEQEDILSWPLDVKMAIHDGWLSVSAASNVALVEDDSHRRLLLSRAKEYGGATARTTAAWVRAWRSSVRPQEATPAKFVSRPPETAATVQYESCFVCEQKFCSDLAAFTPLCPDCLKGIEEARAKPESGNHLHNMGAIKH